LVWLGNDVARFKVVVLAVELPALAREHRGNGLNRLLPTLALVAHADVEGMELGRACRLAHAEIDPAAREQVERGAAVGDAMRLVGGELNYAVAEPNALGALAGGAEEDLGCGGVRVLLQEMMLDLPGVVVAKLVGELDLGERVLQQLILAHRAPGPRQ